MTVAVAAIDPKAPSVTFKGPGGEPRTIKVRDPAKLQGVNVGDMVDLTYAEAIADQGGEGSEEVAPRVSREAAPTSASPVRTREQQHE